MFLDLCFSTLYSAVIISVNSMMLYVCVCMISQSFLIYITPHRSKKHGVTSKPLKWRNTVPDMMFSSGVTVVGLRYRNMWRTVTSLFCTVDCWSTWARKITHASLWETHLQRNRSEGNLLSVLFSSQPRAQDKHTQVLVGEQSRPQNQRQVYCNRTRNREVECFIFV